MSEYKAEFHCIPDYNNCDGEFKTLNAAKSYVNKTMSKLMPHCREIRATITGYTEHECYELLLNGVLKFSSEKDAEESVRILSYTIESLLGHQVDDDFFEKMFSISKRNESVQLNPINYFYKTDAKTFGD